MLNLTIFSAGSFRHVLNELVTIFKQKNPGGSSFTFGAGGVVATTPGS